jgi:hypothetical protein
MQNITHTEDGYELEIIVNKMFTTCGDGYWSTVAQGSVCREHYDVY